MAERFFIQTYGCQMNEYDSAKMADVLASAFNAKATDVAEQADIVLVNTCSVREKAQEKVFSLLGRWREIKEQNPNLIIGVGGCVASQEGAEILKRAPFVDIVFGPQTLHRLPELVVARALGQVARRRRVVPRDREVRQDPAADVVGVHGVPVGDGRLQQGVLVLHRADDARQRDQPAARRRARGSAAARRARRARDHAARPERQRLPRRRERRSQESRPRGADPPGRRDRRHRAHPFHDVASGAVHGVARRRLRRRRQARELPALAGAERLGPRAEAHEARLHGRQIHRQGREAQSRAARHLVVDGLHRRLPRRDRGRLRARR